MCFIQRSLQFLEKRKTEKDKIMETEDKYTDLNYLKKLSNGSNAFVCRMISLFLEQTPMALNELEKYSVIHDWVSLKAVAHKMKPSFSFMGIKGLEEEVLQMEEYCITGKNLDQLPNMIKRVRLVCERAFTELNAENKFFCASGN
jgi:HPt (histidine-containing phosphotransfer) domain-containing protein